MNSQGICFASLQESVDTATPGGKLVFHIFGALAEFERELIRERTNAGLQAARSRGRQGGRPSKLTAKQVKLAKQLFADRSLSIKEICQTLSISRTTLYRLVGEAASKPGVSETESRGQKQNESLNEAYRVDQ